MTEITRIFNVDTRAITNVQRKYAGVSCDSLSTTMHFEYNPVNFLSGNDYVPYIMFNVHDDDGNPLIYGPESTPKFDGWTFQIPWDVTSRVKTQSVDYQLFFVKINVNYNPSTGVPHLDSTDYIISALDGIALKKSIQCKSDKRSCCPPMAPTTEPSVVGYINLWKEYGLVVEPDAEYNEDIDRVQVHFRTYNGNRDCTVTLDVPVLDEDGKIPLRFFDMVTRILEGGYYEETYQIPSAKAVWDFVMENFNPKSRGIPAWDSAKTYQDGAVVEYRGAIYISCHDDNTDNEPKTSPQYYIDSEAKDPHWNMIAQYNIVLNAPTGIEGGSTVDVPSESLVMQMLVPKLDDSQVISSWDEYDPSKTGQDIQIISAKLSYDSIETKIDDSQIIRDWSELDPSKVGVDIQIPSALMVSDSLDSKLDDSQLVNDWNDLSTDKIPNQKLVRESIDGMLDDSQVIEDWSELDPSKTGQDIQIPSAVLTKGSLDDKLDDSQITQEITYEQDEIPSGFAITNALDLKVDKTQIVQTMEVSESKIPSTALIKQALDSKLDDSQLVTEWNDPTDEQIPSAKLVKDSIDPLTDYRMAIRFWYPETIYTNGSTVIYDGTIYISRADENRGHVPNDSTEHGQWWSKIEGGGGGSGNRIYVDIIGNGVDTIYTVQHGLGSCDIFYSMRYNDSNREFTDADVYVIDDNTIRVETYVPLPMDSLVITIGVGLNGLPFNEVIGNGTDTSFDLRHNFGTFDFFWEVQDVATGLFIKAKMYAINPSMARVVFEEPPATDSIRVMLSPNVDGTARSTFYIDTPSAEWTVNHRFGRPVFVQVYDENWEELTGLVQQDTVGLNSVTVRFNHEHTGYVIVM
jgi:hypothetical protein